MGAIVYQITGDQNPYMVQLLPGFPVVVVNMPGTYQITDVPNGNYTLRITDKNGCVNEIPVSVSEYTTTTTTTEISTTTTTIIIQIVPCNMVLFVDNAGFYKRDYEITLSSDLGFVALNFSVGSVPIRFVLNYDGADVTDSGYHGNGSYQAALTAALALLGEPDAVIDTNTEYGLSFIKTTTSEFAILSVYSPLNNASGAFSVSCVDSSYNTTFEGVFDEHLCILSNTTTTTTTEITTTTTTLQCIGIEERDFITNLASRTVVRDFICRFEEIPVGTVDVYRFVVTDEGTIKQDVLYYYDEETWLTIYGFELFIDDSEDLDGVIIEYEFERQTR